MSVSPREEGAASVSNTHRKGGVTYVISSPREGGMVSVSVNPREEGVASVSNTSKEGGVASVINSPSEGGMDSVSKSPREAGAVSMPKGVLTLHFSFH